MRFLKKVEEKVARHGVVEKLLHDPAVTQDPSKLRELGKELRALEKDAAEKEGLLAHFRTAAQEHHQRAAALEERLAARTLELHHLQKHERVKERYERHEKRAQKRKKK